MSSGLSDDEKYQLMIKQLKKDGRVVGIEFLDVSQRASAEELSNIQFQTV